MFDKLLPIIKPTLVKLENIQEELNEIFSSHIVTSAKYVKLFEKKCANYIGVKHAIAVSSATSGLILAVKALGLKGEVIVPSFTFTATVHSLVWNNIKPVFVDCEKGTFNIDVSKIEEKITDETTAIMPVYIFGNPPKIDELTALAKKYNLKLIFDSAQGLGSYYKNKKAGNFGDAEVFSFSPTKVVTAIEAGIITTNNDDLANYLYQARDYGKSMDGQDIDFVGLSARLSEIHALIGLKNLDFIDVSISVRSEMILLYKKLLSNIEGISFQKVLDENKSSANYMVIFIDEKKFKLSRDELFLKLREKNIQTKKYFHPPIHLQRAYSKYKNQNLPITIKAANEGLALPLYGHITPHIVKKVCLAIKKIKEG
jgi:dTDP-4-amino-4,6-dideoxygalactose transaminase